MIHIALIETVVVYRLIIFPASISMGRIPTSRMNAKYTYVFSSSEQDLGIHISSRYTFWQAVEWSTLDFWTSNN
jgi:hypothetical protein